MNDPILRLREDAYWVADDTGITALTHRGFSTLTMSGADRWLERLAPYLDGQHSMNEFLASAPEDAREFIERLLRKLIDRGLVGALDAHPLADTPEVSLIGYFRPDAATIVDTWRRRRTTVVGRRRLADAIATACGRAGMCDVVRAPEAIPNTGQVVQVAASSDVDSLQLVESGCTVRGLPLLQIVLDGSVAWIAPPALPFSSARPRIWARSQPAVDPAEPAETVLANHVTQLLLHYDRTDRHPVQLTRFDAPDLAFSTHRCVPAPLSAPARVESEGEFDRRFRALIGAEPRSAEQFSRAAAVLTDGYIGVFDKVEEADLVQSPLRVAQTTVTLPGRRQRVCGVSIDAAQARYAAATEAIRCYSSLVVDSRRLVRGSMVRAFDLVTERPTLLRATLAFASADGTDRYRAPTGLGAALDLTDAIDAGLIDHCRRRTVTESRTATHPFPRIDPADSRDDVVGYCRTMLVAIGCQVEVFDVTGSLGVPTYAVLLDGATVAYGCGTDNDAALRDGMLAALAAWQSRHAGQSEYAPATVAELPGGVRGDAEPMADRDPLQRRNLVDALMIGGYTVVAAMLDHDSQVHDVLPVVQVRVTR
ncbi:YcaO-like family protein [Nocardia sp. NPDC059195]|uniref:YcaO-like family protein n=1 Tax=Nocardia sp. NPDC059195 TaxID=3346765 RepID=UPI0036B24BDD